MTRNETIFVKIQSRTYFTKKKSHFELFSNFKYV